MSDRKESARLPGSRGRMRTLAARLSHPVLAGLGVAGFVTLASALLTRGADPSATQLTEAHIGQAAKVDVRATQPLYVPDDATTRRLRDEAARAIPPVYAYDASLAEANAAVLREAFALVRPGFEAYEREVRAAASSEAAEKKAEAAPDAATRGGSRTRTEDPARKAAVKGIPTDGPETPEGRRLRPGVHRPIALKLRRFLERARPDFLRLVSVSAAQYEALARMRFSPEAEKIALRLLSAALKHFVVRDKVKFLIDISGGAMIRHERAEKLTPLDKVVNPDDVLDLLGAKGRIAEVASEVAAELPPALRDALASCARRLVAENLTYDARTTASHRKRARESVPAQFRYYPRGSVLLRQGDVISADHIRTLRTFAPGASGPDTTRTFFGNAFLVSLLALLAYLATRRVRARRRPSTRDYLFLSVMMLFTLFLARSSIEVSEILHERWTVISLSVFLLAIPLSVGTMLVRLVLSAELSILFAFGSTLLVGLLAGGNLYYATCVFAGGFAASLSAGGVRQRVHLLKAGMQVGVAQLGAVLCITLAVGQGAFPIGTGEAHAGQGLFALSFLYDVGAAFVSGALAGLLAAALIPVIEATFGYTTDLKYLELANLENPLLKELFLRAPGTYHHSVVAGSLAEASAEAIGANPSLARVGAYYHDVGKGKCPHYFAENLRGANPHDKLSPHMSALILKTHVKDGAEILREHKMPRPIVDICEQHLGTTLIEYFYVKATRKAEEEDTSPPEEIDFRYPGPKPQFRESALVFLADSIEAAARAIPEPTQPKLEEMVRRIIRNKFVDGQLDECDLTLRDFDAIAKAMVRVLVAIHHTRPQYPSQVEAQKQAQTPNATPANGLISLEDIRRSQQR